uniref:Uncharacterized protein n=1 Tax=Fagus sylvatica TaxID=28930 RepID=A0A2N9GSS6_FAGSY
MIQRSLVVSNTPKEKVRDTFPKAAFAQRFSPTHCNLVHEPRPLGKRFTSATTRNFRIVKSSSGQARNLSQKMTPWHKEHSDGLRSQGSYLANPSSPLCKACTVWKSRVFLTRNKLIHKPGCVGKKTHSCTTWNSRIAKILSGQAGILIGKLPSNGPKTLRWPLFAEPYLTSPSSDFRKSGTLQKFEEKRAGRKTHFSSRTAAFARRVFPARNKLIYEPGCVGKITTPATSWNSRFAESIPRLIGIFTGKVHENSSDTPTSGSHNSLIRTPIHANFVPLERGRRELSGDMLHDPF